MTGPTHSIIGVAIYQAIPDPVLAVPLAILSHPVLDKIFCIYHPDRLMRLDSFGKWLIWISNILAGGILLLLVRNLNALIFGVFFSMLWDLQWILKWMVGKDILPLHSWIGRNYHSDRWQFAMIEIFMMSFGLFAIWRNL